MVLFSLFNRDLYFHSANSCTMVFFKNSLWIIVPLVIGFGFWIPELGFIVPVVFLGAFISGLLGGRWFCGNLCPRGNFHDYILGRFTRNAKIPAIFRKTWFRFTVLALLMGFMIVRLASTQGILERIGFVFVLMCTATTAISLALGIGFSPRAWCVFCPFGTIQAYIGKGRHSPSFIKELCNECGRCECVCPMQLDCRSQPQKDCIVCGECVKACPKNAFSLGK